MYYSDLRHSHKSCSQSKHHPKTLHDSRQTVSYKLNKKSAEGVNTQHGESNKLIKSNIGNTIKSDIHGRVLHDSQLTKKSEPSFRECECGHDCIHDVDITENGKVILCSDCGDDVTYSYTAYYNHASHTVNEEITLRFKDLDDDEIENNFLNVRELNCTQNQPGCNFTGFNMHLNMDLNADFAIICSSSFYDCAQFDCSINDFNSQKLNIKDYNLEYYMFTNPDIIILNLAKTYTPSYNHCPIFDVKTAFDAAISSNNYIPTHFYQNVYCNSHGENPIIFSADEYALSNLLTNGGNKKCLI